MTFFVLNSQCLISIIGLVDCKEFRLEMWGRDIGGNIFTGC